MSPKKFYELMIAQGRFMTIKNDWLVLEPTDGLSAQEIIYLASHGKELKEYVKTQEAS
ncbi:hypothetical protein 6939_0009 [Klebsiella phage 6939]|uniref:Uncharacterized protein n=1 Tax=Klebsiella phage 6939 TaxID=2912295 RepID=A0A9E7SBP1_9CAUD|nr:hypothetical protein 6939_0009 [Klebsiella phage 6939]